MGAGLTKTYALPPWGADIRHVFTEMAAVLDLRVLELSETAITVEGPDGNREIWRPIGAVAAAACLT